MSKLMILTEKNGDKVAILRDRIYKIDETAWSTESGWVEGSYVTFNIGGEKTGYLTVAESFLTVTQMYDGTLA